MNIYIYIYIENEDLKKLLNKINYIIASSHAKIKINVLYLEQK